MEISYGLSEIIIKETLEFNNIFILNIEIFINLAWDLSIGN